MFTPQTNQQSFSSVELSALSKSKTAEFLNEVKAKIDWSKIEKILMPTYCQDNGRPSFAPSILFRGLLLEQWYDLSDKALEEELKDRLSFLPKLCESEVKSGRSGRNHICAVSPETSREQPLFIARPSWLTPLRL